jgi:esterase/lipase superfamily enzyme
MLFIGHVGVGMKVTERWFSERLHQPLSVARWGHFGTPVLLFPTAGGDAEEVERQGLVGACWPLVESGRVKLYSCDSVAGRALATGEGSPEHRMWLFNQFHQAVRHEVVPAIHADLGGQPQRIITAGASIGAFNAVAVLCRFPDVFQTAVGMSGTYRLQTVHGRPLQRRPVLLLPARLRARTRRPPARRAEAAVRGPRLR